MNNTEKIVERIEKNTGMKFPRISFVTEKTYRPRRTSSIIGDDDCYRCEKCLSLPIVKNGRYVCPVCDCGEEDAK